MITCHVKQLLVSMPKDVVSNPKAVRGYAFYDWGKSAFETSVTVAILPAWFAYLFLEANGLTTSLGSIEMTGDAIWSFAVTAATLMVAIVSPSFGIIADRRTIKLRWLKILTYVGAGSTLLLAFAPLLPFDKQWLWLMVMFIMANVGLNGAGVFYNSLLPHIGTNEEMDGISNKAFAYGYFGGGILLLVHLALVMLVVDDSGSTQSWVIPFCMASSGIWWYGFSLLTFMWVDEPPVENEIEALKFNEYAKLAFKEIKKTLSETRKFKTLFIYMLAYFFFIDGINSVTSLGGVFGVTVLGITTIDLMITIVLIQFVAAPAAIGFTKIAKHLGTKNALNISLVGWVLLCFAALSFAPLEPSIHEDYDIRYSWDESQNYYIANISSSTYNLAQKLDFTEDEFNEQVWAANWEHVLPVEVNSKIEEGRTLKWIKDTNVTGINSSDISAFLETVTNTRFSASVVGGEFNETTVVGVDHPTNLGDGKIDKIPIFVREHLWAPLGLAVGLQFLLLGCCMGLLLGGSQGLARSLFGQIIPETRSTEFFGFFGFFGKVAAAIGPLLYGTMTVIFDSRVGLLSVSILILIGATMMYFVDVEQGIKDAKLEDLKNRGFSEE